MRISTAPAGLCLALALSLGASAQPLLTEGRAVNAADYTPPDFPGGPIAQGSLFVLFGSGLGPTPGKQATAFPLGTALAGVSIKVTGGGTTVNALPVYVSDAQVNAIMPSNTPIGAVTITLTYQGADSNAIDAQVVKTDLGLFALNGGGLGPAALQNFLPSSLPINSRTQPAKPGQTVIVYGTGLGAGLNADNVAPQAGNLPENMTILVGGKQAKKSYSGRSPCCSGLDQIAFAVPADAPLSCSVPVQVVPADGAPSNVVNIAISADGGPCTDAANPFGQGLKGKTGAVFLVHASGPPSTGLSADLFAAGFRRDTDAQFAFSPFYSLPPAGTCTEYLGNGNFFTGAPLPAMTPSGGTLDAGTLTVTSGAGSDTVKSAGGLYTALLGVSGSSPFLTGGSYKVSGAGGADVGPFSVTLADAPVVAWSITSNTVTRSSGLTVKWNVSGGDASKQLAIIAGGNAIPVDNSTELFVCAANGADGSFTVPPSILTRVPATSQGMVAVGLLPAAPQATFTATGLDSGFADSLSLSLQFVSFK
ncbi:MAG TPA: hypothetical protein VFA04_16265 [Bryobacteraceae bacterium]|nr:hypothetical protein [Bryobacteraceae bacterium]